jgi:hypothetical protein
MCLVEFAKRMIIIDQIVKMTSFPSTIEQIITFHILTSNQGSRVH